MNLNQEIINDIKKISVKYSEIENIVLFGSRARGDNSERSDIDLAIYATNNSFKKSFDFKYDIETEVNTLLKFDFVCIDKNTDEKLINEINSEGIIIYEKS